MQTGIFKEWSDGTQTIDDPSTYLDTLQPSSEDQTKVYLGFAGGVDNPSAKAVGLDEFAKLLDDANNETQDVVKRYEKYAAAQAWLTDSAIVIPTMSSHQVQQQLSLKWFHSLDLHLKQVTKDQHTSNMLKFKMNLLLRNNTIKHVKNGKKKKLSQTKKLNKILKNTLNN